MLALILAAAIVVALNAYVLLAGADFGGGVWDLFASGPRRERQRELVAHAIGPVWEANHVWLILVIVLLFTCFSPVFARVATVLHIPLTLMLVGIVLRGSAFVFRTYSPSTPWPPLPPRGEGRRAVVGWGRVFAVSSLLTPFLLGTVVGAIAAGRVTAPGSRDFYGSFVAPWLAPFPLALGSLSVVAFAFIAAVYLTLEADTLDLREDFRTRALLAGVLLFVAAAVSMVLALEQAPLIREGLIVSPRALVVHALTGAAALTALGALWRRRYRLARVAAAAQVSCILWGWAVAQYPYLVPPDLTLRNAAAPPLTLRLALIALGAGALLLIPSLAYLLRIFKGSLGASLTEAGRASGESAPPTHP